MAENTRREDFPLESFRYLEQKLGEIRRETMDKAANLAATETDSEVYQVEPSHVDQALVVVIQARSRSPDNRP
jgi:hypothetical protein